EAHRQGAVSPAPAAVFRILAPGWNTMSTPDSHSARDDYPVSAEDWLARLLSPECTPEEHSAFEDWLALSPDNVVAYAEAEHLHALARVAARDVAQPATTIRQAMPARRRRRWSPGLALAATLVTALGLAAWLQ